MLMYVDSENITLSLLSLTTVMHLTHTLIAWTSRSWFKLLLLLLLLTLITRTMRYGHISPLLYIGSLLVDSELILNLWFIDLVCTLLTTETCFGTLSSYDQATACDTGCYQTSTYWPETCQVLKALKFSLCKSYYLHRFLLSVYIIFIITHASKI